MEIRHLKAFLAVAERLSFNRAAESLHYAQSSISAQIQSLEDELGVRLFERLGRRILLTESGERLLDYARKMLDLEEEARSEVSLEGLVEGALTIRAPESLCVHRLPPAIMRFRSLRPRVRLHFITCAHDGLARDLRKGVTDLAFLLTDSIQDADLEFEIFGVEPLVLVSGPGHPLVGRSRIETADLAGETLLLSRVDCSYRRMFEQVLEEEGVRPGAALEFNSVAAITACVAGGLGITIMPEPAAAGAVDRGELVVLPWADGPLEAAEMMIWHQDRWMSPTLGAFMEVVREVLAVK